MFKQTPGTRWTFIIVGFLGAILPLPAVLDESVSTGVRLTLYLPYLAWCMWMILRLSRCGIKDAGDALVVRNPVRTISIPWSSVAEFEHGRFGILPKVGVRRIDGSSVGVFGLPVAAHGPDPSTRRLLDSYEAKLKTRQAPPELGS